MRLSGLVSEIHLQAKSQEEITMMRRAQQSARDKARNQRLLEEKEKASKVCLHGLAFVSHWTNFDN